MSGKEKQNPKQKRCTSQQALQPTPAPIMNATEPNVIMPNPANDTHDHEGNNIGQATYSKLSQKQRELMYHASPNTNRVYMQDETSHIDFTTHFKYLGTYISFDLSADYDINNRITKASREMGRLRHFFNNHSYNILLMSSFGAVKAGPFATTISDSSTHSYTKAYGGSYTFECLKLLTII